VSFEVLLYDLTSTYVEGEAEQNRKAKRGYSRDGRPHCKPVIVALVIMPEGFPLAYEVMDGNNSDQTTLRGFLTKIEKLYGQARRVWLMDRGVPTEAVFEEMRTAERQRFYLVGTPKTRVTKYEKQWLELPWRKVRDSVEVKLFSQAGERYVLAKSEGRSKKRSPCAQETGALTRQAAPDAPEFAPARSAAAAHRSRQERGGVRVRVREDSRARKRRSGHAQDVYVSHRPEPAQRRPRRDGHYWLRTNLVAEDPAVLWDRYMQLTQIEAAFKCLKSELGIRPIYHPLEHRVEAHILVAFLTYCWSVTLRYCLQAHAPGLTPRRLRTARQHSEARRFLPDHGWSLPDQAALHRTGRRSRAAAASTQS
jgi:hypothetical protein